MSPTLVEEIAETTGGGVGNAVCHLFANYGHAERAHCGVPRSEQEPHRVYESFTAPFCATCGLPRCPRCRDVHLSRL